MRPLLPWVLLATLASPLANAGQAPALSAQQSADFAAAQRTFAAGDWASAYDKLRPLHEAEPSNTLLAKYTAESAINTGNAAYAQSILTPVLATAPDDWQAHTLQARIFAEARNDAARDSELRQLTTLHGSTTDPRFRQQTQVLLERDQLQAGHVDLFYSLQPWSRYNIYQMARVYNSQGKQTLRITLESGDFDQPNWAKQHPDLAAKGERAFSMDGYSDQPPAQPGGQPTQTHMTYGFFDGQPQYNTVRDRMLAIAAGNATAPISSTSGIVPKP